MLSSLSHCVGPNVLAKSLLGGRGRLRRAGAAGSEAFGWTSDVCDREWAEDSSETAAVGACRLCGCCGIAADTL